MALRRIMGTLLLAAGVAVTLVGALYMLNKEWALITLAAYEEDGTVPGVPAFAERAIVNAIAFAPITIAIGVGTAIVGFYTRE